MNWLAAEVGETPPGVVTTTLTTPADPAGEVAVMEMLEFTTKPADAPPNLTAEAFVKSVPVRATDVPPAVGPAAGLTAVTVGTGW